MSYSENQLLSYLMVKNAKYGVVATATKISLYNCFNRSLSLIKDIPISYRNNEDLIIDTDANNAEMVETFGIDKLIKHKHNDSTIVIGDNKIRIKNSDLITFPKLKKVLIQRAIVLHKSPSNAEWVKAVSFLFKNSEQDVDTDFNSDLFYELRFILEEWVKKKRSIS